MRSSAARRLLRTLFRRPVQAGPAEPAVAGQHPRVPPGVCVYAVGDVHGRADLLEELHRIIVEDAEQLTPGTEKLVVYLGDYVDRGLESRQVIEILLHDRLPDFQAVHLMGNHDAWLLSFLVDAEVGRSWLRYGGDVTLFSYGVRVSQDEDDPKSFEVLQMALRAKIPQDHVDFLRRLELTFQSGDYLFVHAGIRPGVPIAQQMADDVLWIREPFLSWKQDFGKIVVHGHTVEPEPAIRRNRIGIDTGACWTGRLTCLVLEEETRRFLSTAEVLSPPPPS